MSDSSQDPASEVSKTVDSDSQEVKGEATIESLEKTVIAIPEPMREDQVQNAVQFLAHPKVRGSPVIYRRAFLEKKGLTKEEIDEAFRRVPDPSSNVATVEATTTSQAIPPKPSTTLQPQVPSQVSQQPFTVASALTSFYHSRFHWSQALFVVGIISASGAGTAVLLKKKIIPKLKAWIRKVVVEENDSKLSKKSRADIAEEAAEAAKTAASAATAVAIASQEILNAKHEERKYFEAFTRVLDVQLEEMKSMGNAIRKMKIARKEITEDKGTQGYTQSEIWKGTTNNPLRATQSSQSSSTFTSGSKLQKVNGSLDKDLGIVKHSSSPSESTTALPHPKSYMEIIDMIQRGEKPPNIKDIDDSPPYPNQPIAKPLLAPRPKPWEVGQPALRRPTYDHHSHATGQGLNSEVPEANFQLNENHSGSEPWKKKTIKISHSESETEEFYDAMVRTTGSPMKRGWVPARTPRIVMPKTVDAIRKTKSFTPKLHPVADDSITVTINREVDTKSCDTVVEHESWGIDLNQANQENEVGVEINE